MKSEAKTPEEYVNDLPDERRTAINRLREITKKNLPKGFVEEMNYGMIGYVVPLSIYPKGYLGNKNQPLPFMNIASQKHTVTVYHMGINVDKKLMNWFKDEYEKTSFRKLDMGKSCLRLKDMDSIPYKLIGELAAKMSVDEWIKKYEEAKGTN